VSSHKKWWHSSIKVSPCGDKFEGNPLIHHLSQSHLNFVDLNTIKKEEAQRPSTTCTGNQNREGGTTPGNVESTNNRGRINNIGSNKNVEITNNRGDINDRGRIKIDWSRGNFLENLSIILLEGMGQCPTRERSEEEMVDDNFTTTQQLSLCPDSHSSTLSFSLETLAQHHTLISQLQDEFEFLTRQGENIETKLEARPPNSLVQSQNEETESRPESMPPDLNVVLEPPLEEDQN
jgi:hypothetical protein